MTVGSRRKSVVILDYGSGNLRSAQRALERVGAAVVVTADRAAALNCDGLVVPGVGAFEACMSGLRGIAGDEIIAERVAAQRPVLGVCVGMQILFARGVEFGVESRGAALWPGSVTRLEAPVIPHMGWNVVDAPADSRLFAGLDADTRFLAAVEDGALSATQFHPEKSGDAGAALLTNWVEDL